MKAKKLLFVMGVLVLVGGCGALQAAAPPVLVNYQGVLRDASSKPLDGNYDMSFLFYEAQFGGPLLVADRHWASGTGAVVVSRGLFSVQLGGGSVVGGSFATLFPDNGEVWMAIQVASTGGPLELLGPRFRLTSAAYSLNADHLDGKDSTEFLDTSANPQTKAGDLDVQGDVAVGGDVLFFDGSVQATAYAPADPPCFDTANRFVDCGNGTVTDTVTGLIWLQDASCATLPGLGGSEFGNYQVANEAAASLQDGDCGLTDHSSAGDWRLPTVAEWQVIIDRATTNGCVSPGPFVPNAFGTGCWSEGDPFAGVKSSSYWSSTTYALSPDSARGTRLTSGDVLLISHKNNDNFVWPVRAGP